MLRQYWTSEFAIVAMLCVAAIFLFPAMQGPYSAVHGPVTALLSVRARQELWLEMALAGSLLLHWMRLRLMAACLSSQHGEQARDLATAMAEPGATAILRC
ncbi:MAG: hypothetical protein ABSD20_11975 [Terriglobales bacterium]